MRKCYSTFDLNCRYIIFGRVEIIFCVCTISLFSPPNSVLFARSGPPFVIRSVLIGRGCPGLQMVDLSERKNRLWGEREGRSRKQRITYSFNLPMPYLSILRDLI